MMLLGRSRHPALASLTLAALTVLSACAPSGSAPPVSTGTTSAAPVATPTAAVATPKAGGTLRVGIEADLREADNLQARISVDKLVMGSTVFDALFASDEQGLWKPALAKTAAPSADLLTWTFGLQSGVKFHNGKAFTAKDVKDNIEAYLDKANASNLAGDLGNVASVEVVDPATVKFMLKKPEAAFPATLTDTIFIGDMDARKQLGVDAWRKAPVGTGPYKWTSRVSGDNVTFERNADYWRGRPPLDKVVFKVYPDVNVAALALQRGEVDILANNVSVNALSGLRQRNDLQVYGIEGNTWYLAFTNFEKARKGAYKDPLAFRQGLAHLMNAKESIPQIIGDFGSYANQPIPPWQTGHDKDLKEIAYDPAKGKTLLAQAGYPAGSTIKLLVFQRPFNCEWATALQSSLQKEGFKVELQCLKPEVAPATIQKYEWDLLFARTSGRSTSAVFLKDRWRRSLADKPDDFYTLRSDKLEGMINQMLALKVDDPKYATLGKQASQLIVNEEVAAIGGYWDKSWWAASNKVKGLRLSPIVYYGFLMNAITTVWIE